MTEHNCTYCESTDLAWTWETVARGWRFMCNSCFYNEATVILRSLCVLYVATTYYPTFDYDTRTIK